MICVLLKLWMVAYCTYIVVPAPITQVEQELVVDLQEESTKPVVGIEEAKQYLTQYGYIDISAKAVTSLTQEEVVVVDPELDDSLRAALRRFQSMADLPQTGELDTSTQGKMAMPRCGFPDIVPSGSRLNNKRRRRFLVSGSRWPANILSYSVGSFPRAELNLSEAEVMSTVRQALKFWSDASSLTFVQTSSKKADIQMNFVVGDHGDMSPFQGPGRVLAHASYPVHGGDLHWDGDETWTVGSNKGRSLLYVTMHELGHALGLAHSDKRNSIMAPFYKRYNVDLALSQDDIDGIQNIYGPPSPPTPTPVTASDSDTTPKELFESITAEATDNTPMYSTISSTASAAATSQTISETITITMPRTVGISTTASPPTSETRSATAASLSIIITATETSATVTITTPVTATTTTSYETTKSDRR